jgi:hypothetical protein
MDEFEEEGCWTDWCETCNCPIGIGPCPGCVAYSVAVVQEDCPEEGDWREDE